MQERKTTANYRHTENLLILLYGQGLTADTHNPQIKRKEKEMEDSGVAPIRRTEANASYEICQIILFLYLNLPSLKILSHELKQINIRSSPVFSTGPELDPSKHH